MVREDRSRPFDRLVDDKLLDRDRFALFVAMKEVALLRGEATGAENEISEQGDPVYRFDGVAPDAVLRVADGDAAELRQPRMRDDQSIGIGICEWP